MFSDMLKAEGEKLSASQRSKEAAQVLEHKLKSQLMSQVYDNMVNDFNLAGYRFYAKPRGEMSHNSSNETWEGRALMYMYKGALICAYLDKSDSEECGQSLDEISAYCEQDRYHYRHTSLLRVVQAPNAAGYVYEVTLAGAAKEQRSEVRNLSDPIEVIQAIAADMALYVRLETT